MPRTCTVCSHNERRKIDRAIVFGKSNRAIAGQFRVTRASVQRHKQHVAAASQISGFDSRIIDTIDVRLGAKCYRITYYQTKGSDELIWSETLRRIEEIPCDQVVEPVP